MTWIRRYAHLPLACALAGVLWWVLAAEVRDSGPAIGDEVNWITAGAQTFDLVRRGAGPAKWEAAEGERWMGSFGNMNPPVGKWLIGSFLALAGIDEPVHWFWDFGLKPAANRALGNVPPPHVVRPARLGVSVLAGITLLLVYICALQATGARWCSLAAPLVLFAFDPFRMHASSVYTDVPQLCALLGAVAAFNHYLAHGQRLAFAAATVLIGLATATKFSAAPVVLAMALLPLLGPGPLPRRLATSALAGAIPVAIFVAVNPYLYPDPLGRTLEIVELWNNLYAGLVRNPAFAAQVVDSPLHGLGLVLQRSVIAPGIHESVDAVLLMRTGGFLGTAALAALAIAATRLLRRLPGRMRAVTTGVVVVASAAAQIALGIGAWTGWFALGAARLVAGPLGSVARPPQPRVRAFLLTAWMLTWLMTGTTLALDFNRYYLRTLTLSAVVFAAGIAWFADLLFAPGAVATADEGAGRDH